MSETLCFATPSLLRSGIRISSANSLRRTRCPETSRRFSVLRPSQRVSTNATRMAADDGKAPDERNDGRATSGMFGIKLETNGDVIKFGALAIAIAYGIKTALQVGGVPDLLAGQLTTGFVSVLSLLGWVSTYVFRVGTKGMTYAQQLRDYESEVIKKRYEELTEEELAALSEELNDDI